MWAIGIVIGGMVGPYAESHKMMLVSRLMLSGMEREGGDLSWDMLWKNPSLTRSPVYCVLPTVRDWMVLCLVALRLWIWRNA